MMRKDVKVGLASGAVLLAVGIVYVSSINKPPTARTVSKLDRPAERPSGADASAGNGGGGRIVIGEAGREPAAQRPPVTEAVANVPTEQDWSKLLGTGAPPALMSHTPAPGAAAAEPAAGANGEPVDVFAESTPIGPVASAAQDVSTVNATSAMPAAPVAPTLSATVTTGTTPVVPALQTTTVVRTAPAPAAATARQQQYTVKEGESFYTIARDVYGDSHFFPHIQRANPDIVPTKIRAGMKINLPAPDAVKPTATAAALGTTVTEPTRKAAAAPGKPLGANSYRVQENENLYRIAVKLYGSPKKMDEIYELNRATIGSDPAKLKVGTVLKLPAGARADR